MCLSKPPAEKYTLINLYNERVRTLADHPHKTSLGDNPGPQYDHSWDLLDERRCQGNRRRGRSLALKGWGCKSAKEGNWGGPDYRRLGVRSRADRVDEVVSLGVEKSAMVEGGKGKILTHL